MVLATKQDSNATGLRIAEEASLGVLPGTPVWYPAEPNSYNNFGGQIKTTARTPINASRQRQKGVTVDLDASGGFNADMTQESFQRLMQGFFFADFREKYDSAAINDLTPVTDISADGTLHQYDSAAFGLAGKVLVNSLIFVDGFATAANNGLKVVASVTADTGIAVTDTGLVDEAAAATARIRVVGYQFASGTVDIVAGANPKISRSSGVVDLTTLGLMPGEWVWVGGDAAAEKWTTTANNGWARVLSVSASAITFDKTTSVMVNETGTGKTINVFFATRVVKNESDPTLIKRRSYQLERSLGTPDLAQLSQIQGEYLVGSVPNEITFNFQTADKATADLSFVSTDHETVTGAVGLKAGTRPTLVKSDSFNTTSNVSRLKMSVIDAATSAPSALFAYVTDFKLTINNNVSPDKAVGVLGAFDVTVGDFAVSGTTTAYFADVAAVQAVRDNSDVTFDFALVKANKGVVFDVPLIALGDARANVVKDKAIELPINIDAAADAVFNHTLLMQFHDYLPDLAA